MPLKVNKEISLTYYHISIYHGHGMVLQTHPL